MSSEYKQLPGSARTSASLLIASRHTLWQGSDHLLSVTNDGYAETYKRFYYRDIQALILRETDDFLAGRIALGFLSGVLGSLGLAGLFLQWPTVILICLGVVTALFGFLLAIDVLLGRSCAAYVRTAVQTERLYSLRRMPQARRVLENLGVPIRETQGALDSEVARPLYDEALQAAAARKGEASTNPDATATPATRPAIRRLPMKRYSGYAHEILFAILLADVVHSCLRYFHGGIALLILGLVLGIGMVAIVAVALSKQHRTDLSLGVKALTWATLGYLVMAYFFGILHGLVRSVIHIETTDTPWEAMRAAADIPGQESIVMMVLIGFSLVGSGVLGFTGLLALNRFRKTRGTPPDFA